MRRFASILGFVALALTAWGCGSPPPPIAPTGGPWGARLEVDNPLVGRIWDPAAAAYVNHEDVVRRAGATPYVLLGERHDHPDHHRLQARVLRAVVRAKRTPVLALEMVDTDAQGTIDAAPKDPEGFGRAVGWEARGWPELSLYRPVLDAAAEAELPLVGANLPLAEAKAIAKGGLSIMSPARRDALGLDVPLEPASRASLEEEIRVSHCGHLPEAMIPTMADAQRARDAAMATRLAEIPPAQGAVLIAGAGHVRNDRGVPPYLARKRGAGASLSIAFVEVEVSKLDPRDYAAAFGAKTLPFDYVWFTPRLDDQDPCHAFRKRK